MTPTRQDTARLGPTTPTAAGTYDATAAGYAAAGAYDAYGTAGGLSGGGETTRHPDRMSRHPHTGKPSATNTLTTRQNPLIDSLPTLTLPPLPHTIPPFLYHMAARRIRGVFRCGKDNGVKIRQR
ncbi:hypothetical protein N1851_023792 [Merluccius polli]|uniref:Uncharacterized protein n=1 Tax=Merluccius polli TaxID=89951 RepID=A0AA47MFZ6_MERPO|nr:hypothetical protein N1851_023792 [Merluccius polli]